MNQNEEARSRALPSDGNTLEAFTALNLDIISNPRHILHGQVCAERDALLRAQHPDYATPVVGGVAQK